MMTSDISAGSIFERFMASVITVLPSSCAGTEPSVPLNDPTGVRTPDVITIASSVIIISFCGIWVRREAKDVHLVGLLRWCRNETDQTSPALIIPLADFQFHRHNRREIS